MARKMVSKDKPAPPPRQSKAFHLEFLNSSQKIAYMAFEQHDVLFLLGPAGTAKTFLATAFAIGEIISKKRKKIILTRPMVEAGEKMGFLPGDFSEKIHPYLVPIFDCMDKLIGFDTLDRERVNRSMEIVPIAFARGRTFENSVIIFDEAQNATDEQLKLIITRLGENSKMIITGDPTQSDLKTPEALTNLVQAMKTVPGIGVVEFNESCIVRHPLVAAILAAWPSK